jgi:hypothetical protein
MRRATYLAVFVTGCIVQWGCRAPQKLDDAAYMGDALQHEVALAKQAWLKESAIAERIAVLRSDDTNGCGIRREAGGPEWVRGRLAPDESKYFDRIWAVYLGGTAVTDADVRALAVLTELRELYLHRTSITDAALTEMCSLQKLRVLHLRNTQVSDTGILSLSCLTNLSHLYLYETRVTAAGGTRLRSQLSQTEVEW